MAQEIKELAKQNAIGYRRKLTMAHGLLSKDVELRYSSTAEGTFTKLNGLFEFPDLGGEPDQIDVTNLSDDSFKYIHGLKDYGSLSFGFIYDGMGNTSNYKTLKDLEDAGKTIFWNVVIPKAGDDGATGITFSFSGVPAVYMSGTGVNSRLEFQLSVALDSDIEATFGE